MNISILLISFFILFFLELIYFKIADKYNIIDHPNHRSSHTKVTIRGGGIIFSLALLMGSLYFGIQYAYFLSGLFLISLISFIDDIKTIGNKIRIIFHLVAVGLLFYQLNIYSLPFYWIALGFIFVIGTINAINFMDGINGITGGFGLVTIVTFYYINNYSIAFTDNRYLILSIIALLVFDFFNFRKRAKCFAGDVGSVSLAFIVVFFLLQLIIKTNNLNYLLLLLVYGLDTVITILLRLIRKENVFEAHKSHFYQFLANERKMPHLVVAVLYTFLQALVDIVLINLAFKSIANLIISIVFAVLAFVLLRLYYEGSDKLFNVKQ